MTHTFRVCDDSGEDPTCQDSLRAKQLRHKDHGTYAPPSRRCCHHVLCLTRCCSYFNMSSECDPMYTPVKHKRRQGNV